jgi:hypothetical protein
MRSVVIAAVSCLVVAAAANAQNPQIDPDSFLKAIAVRITLHSVGTNEKVLCYGFVGAADKGANTAYIVTAKPCVQELVEGHRLSAGNNSADLADLKITGEVGFPGGVSGTIHRVMWSTAHDAVILYADYPAASTVQPYQQICRSKCGYYTLRFFWPANIPIYSILPAQGSTPIISTGRLMVDDFSRLTVVLPATQEASGSPVIDGGGALVGILTAPVVTLVPGRAIQNLLESAAAHPQEARAAPVLQTPPPGVTSPVPAKPSVPTQPTLAPLPSPASVSSDPFLIWPGQSIGPISLGMQIQEGIARLGPSKGVQELDDGTVMYRWFEPPRNVGIGARVSPAGVVLRVWVLNDQRYRTKEGELHIGSTEAEVRAALGNPTRVEVNAQGETKILMYESLGLWLSIQLDQQFTFYNTVFDIGVLQPK